MENNKDMVWRSETTKFVFEIKAYLDCGLALVHLMQFVLSVQWRLMEGNERLIDFWREHQMVMEVLGLGVSFTRCKDQGRG